MKKRSRKNVDETSKLWKIAERTAPWENPWVLQAVLPEADEDQL